MLVKTLPVGQLETNCYVVTNEKTLECVVIDPGDESNIILDYLEDNRLVCKAIFLTHGHWDHIGAVKAVAEETKAPVYLNELDSAEKTVDRRFAYLLPENTLNYGEGSELDIAGLHFSVLATPGHTQGSVTILCENAMFSGDTLFRGSCGRTDLPGGDMDDELHSLRRLCELPDDYEVYPGHMDSSSLERERAFNYYCRLAMRG
ncbi:MAG: MBL fold metallo-hydrolase [Oscillospiraceae bacterium]|nr:MBL fold metallo-hydrolase [Oscillospiraceae bacterium]